MSDRRVETVLRVVGGVSLFLAVLLVVPSLVSRGTDYPEPGADTLHMLSLQHPVHVFALVLAVIGVVGLGVAWILDRLA
jgi:hypothetical protein